jgi:alkylation response protein AidB-like acyl-CoA dehydrogenase
MTKQDEELLTNEMIERAKRLIPMIRERAKDAEQIRRLHDETMREVERAGLLQMLVPKRWGGMGLGLRALCEVARVLAHGDSSAAWTIAFMIEHNWMACHFDMEVQKKLYAKKPYIRMAAPLIPDGKAERVPGGFRVTGKWRYASAMGNSDWVFVSSPVKEDGEDVVTCFLMPIKDVTVHDEWFFAGMAATSSTNVSAKDAFVPEEMAMEMEIFHTTDQHPGAVHEEPLYRYPILQSLFSMMAAIIVGSAEAVVELGKDRLRESAPWGIKRVTLQTSRFRWGVAHQKARCARLVYDDLLKTAIRKGDAQEPWSLADEGQMALDLMVIGTLCKEAGRIILDGSGSSAFQLSNPLQRYLRDIDVLANHIGFDEDVVGERGSRWVLGLGRVPGDPFPPRETPRRKAAGGSP